jgi:O-antigen/teichoic acid export membrane protein
VSVLLPILAMNIWISAFRTVLSSILAAYDRFDLARGSDLIMLAVRTVMTIAALEMDTGLIGLTVAVIGCNIVGLTLNWIFSKRSHKQLKLWPLMLKKDRLKELYNYGIGAFIVAASAKIIGQTDLILAGNLISIDSVAVYSVGAMLIYYSDTFIKQISRTYFPRLQKAIAIDNLKEARSLLHRQIQLMLLLGTLMYIGYISFGTTFISLWMFDPVIFPMTSVTTAAKIMAILSLAKLLILMGAFSKSILAATGHIGFSAKMTVLEALINLTVSISLVTFFGQGLIGIATGTIVSHLLIQTIIMPYYACNKAGINWFHFVLTVGSKALTSSVLFFLICYSIQKLIEVQTWIGFFIQITISLACYLPVIWFVLLPIDDRRRILKKLKTNYEI